MGIGLGVLFGHHRPVAMGAAMDSGEWPADWMFYTGNNTGLGTQLAWYIAVLTRMRHRSIAQVYEFQGFSQSRCTSCVQEPLYLKPFIKLEPPALANKNNK